VGSGRQLTRTYLNEKPHSDTQKAAHASAVFGDLQLGAVHISLQADHPPRLLIRRSIALRMQANVFDTLGSYRGLNDMEKR